MRHFATLKEAKAFKNSKPQYLGYGIYKKIKGHKNRIKKPFVVGTFFEWLNLY